MWTCTRSQLATQAPYQMSGRSIHNFMVPKRKFWKVGRTFPNAFSKHFSTMWETTFARLTHAGLGKDLTTRHAYYVVCYLR
jgi:hypothetical protein